MTNSNIIIKKQNNTLFEIKNNGDVYIGTKSIEELIQDKINQYDSNVLLTNTVDTRLYYLLNEPNIEYLIRFSDTSSSNIIMNISVLGSDIDNLGIFYKSATNSYYRLVQYYASDDEDDYIEIKKVTQSGSFISNVYFRGIYYNYK